LGNCCPFRTASSCHSIAAFAAMAATS
jgi:hypothetical protein